MMGIARVSSSTLASLDKAALVFRIHEEVDHLIHFLVSKSLQRRDFCIRVSQEEFRSRDAELHLGQVQSDADCGIVSESPRSTWRKSTSSAATKRRPSILHVF